MLFIYIISECEKHVKYVNTPIFSGQEVVLLRVTASGTCINRGVDISAARLYTQEPPLTETVCSVGKAFLTFIRRSHFRIAADTAYTLRVSWCLVVSLCFSVFFSVPVGKKEALVQISPHRFLTNQFLCIIHQVLTQKFSLRWGWGGGGNGYLSWSCM